MDSFGCECIACKNPTVRRHDGPCCSCAEFLLDELQRCYNQTGNTQNDGPKHDVRYAVKSSGFVSDTIHAWIDGLTKENARLLRKIENLEKHVCFSDLDFLFKE